jgi:hypothetical protein
MTKIGGHGSISQRHRSLDPDPHHNVMDPQHCFVGMSSTSTCTPFPPSANTARVSIFLTSLPLLHLLLKQVDTLSVLGGGGGGAKSEEEAMSVFCFSPPSAHRFVFSQLVFLFTLSVVP